MHPHEVVVHEVEREHVQVVFRLLGEAIGQTGEASHPHPHGQVLALNVAGFEQFCGLLEKKLLRSHFDSLKIKDLDLYVNR